MNKCTVLDRRHGGDALEGSCLERMLAAGGRDTMLVRDELSRAGDGDRREERKGKRKAEFYLAILVLHLCGCSSALLPHAMEINNLQTFNITIQYSGPA